MGFPRTATFAFALLLIPAVRAAAQTAPPHIASVLPIGAPRGTTVELTVAGVHIGRGTGLIFEGDGITVESITPEKPPEPSPVKEGEKPPEPPRNPEGRLTARLRIAPDTEPGVRAFRVVTPVGPSDVGWFVVGQWPEAAEQEPNNTPEQAQRVTFPVCLLGRLDPAEDLDYFRFHARAGQTLVFDLLSSRLQLPLDAILTLLDAHGWEIALNEDYNGLDPLLVVTIPRTGDYTLVVRDLRYRGGDRFHYRLSMGELPLVTAVFPPGGRAGTSVDLQLSGVNLGTDALVSVTLPAEAPPAPISKALSLPGGASNPVLLAVEDVPEVMGEERVGALPSLGASEVEKEGGRGLPSSPVVLAGGAAPPGSASVAQPVPVPVVVNGRLLAAGEADQYRFRAEKGQRLLLEVVARRIGSELDSVLSVLDAGGRELATNDDAVGKDSRIEFTAPETGDYIARVRDLHDRHGPGFTYRLLLTASPDFRLTFTPDRLAIGRGGRAPLTVTATRINSFDGEIALEVSGLPEGARVLGPSRIRAGQTEAHLIVAAPMDAPLQAGTLRVTGVAAPEGRTIRRLAQSHEEIVQNEQRTTRPAPLATAAIAEPPDLVVAAMPETIWLAPGGSVELVVRIERKVGFDKTVPLAVLGLPPGVTATTPEIGKDQSEAKITLKADGNATPAEADLVLVAHAVLDGQRQVPHAAPPIRLTVAAAEKS